MRTKRAGARVARAAGLLALVLSSGCDTNTNPVQPTPTVTTDTFTGTFGPQGKNSHPFTVTEPGFMSVTIISLSPDPTLTVGIGLGAPSGADCVLQLRNDAVHQASLLTANATVAGTYCVAIFDVGGLVEDATTDYAVQLSHF
ncbi:MAG: hypothetical protein HYS05_14075 [Acidobacteria bacterium]|nr:hypothetical protein [Acidobacteriota bacterium]